MSMREILKESKFNLGFSTDQAIQEIAAELPKKKTGLIAGHKLGYSEGYNRCLADVKKALGIKEE